MRQTFQTLFSCFVLTSLAFTQDNTPKDFAYYWRQARTSYEANNPLFNEPTLGALVQNTFYYVANSQWGSFNKDGTLFPPEKLQEPIIMMTKIR